MSELMQFGFIILGILIIILLGVYLFFGKVPSLGSMFSIPSERMTTSPGPLDCRSQAALMAAKSYYDKSSSYSGLFVMNPISSTPIDASSCSVRYQPSPISSVQSNSSTEERPFTYVLGSTGWQAVDMGDLKSGTLSAPVGLTPGMSG